VETGAEAVQAVLDSVFDEAVVRHGFAPYLRDYLLDVELAGERRRLVFVHCVEAHVTTALPPEVWRESLDDRLLDPEPADADGYVWGVRWQDAYPGGRVVPGSERARHWSEALGLPFTEAVLELNAQVLTLVFAGVRVTEPAPEA
jgi:hypothetical protein